MRTDMKWIIGDQRGSRLSGPRKGRRFSPAEFRKYDWDIDDAPFVGGLVGHALEKSLIGGRRGGRGYKSKPIERYIATQVGRLWNDVLSEMRAALRGTAIAEAHWPNILSSIVAARGSVVDGHVMVESWCGRSIPLSQGPNFYVDPRTARLHRNTEIETPRMRKKRLEAEQIAQMAFRMRAVSPTRQLHRLLDAWWGITLTELDPLRDLKRDWTDVVLSAGLSDLPRQILYGRARAFASAKRPLSTVEIKRYELD
jgi:hypothetical protein